MNNNKSGLTLTKTPSVILLDIETSPIVSYTWGTYQQNSLKVLESSKIISVAWKELYSKDTNVLCVHDYRGYKAGKIDDEKLVKDTWEVLDKADVVIAHHGDAFDLKKLNSRFVFHGLNAPSSYKTVDTKKVASRYFKFDSNSLNNLGQSLNLGAKFENGGFDLWVRCIAGDPEAWSVMKEYNKQDVVLLEKLYLTLRPFIENHPNLNAALENPKPEVTCPTCLSENVSKRGFSTTRTGRKQRYQCSDCGSWSSGSFQKVKILTASEDSD